MDDKCRIYREKAWELAPDHLVSLRNLVTEYKRANRTPGLIYAALLERYLDLCAYWCEGHADLLGEQDAQRFQREFTKLGEWLTLTGQYDEIMVEKLVGAMHSSGLPEAVIVRERKLALAKPRGQPRKEESLQLTFTATALRLEGKSYCEIADALCPEKKHRPHRNEAPQPIYLNTVVSRGAKLRGSKIGDKNPCAHRFETRVVPLIKFLQESGFDITDTAGNNLLLPNRAFPAV